MEHLRRVDGVYIGEMEDEDVRIVPVWLVGRVMLVVPVKLEPPQSFCVRRATRGGGEQRAQYQRPS